MTLFILFQIKVSYVPMLPSSSGHVKKSTDSRTQKLCFKISEIIFPYNNYSFGTYNNVTTLW